MEPVSLPRLTRPPVAKPPITSSSRATKRILPDWASKRESIPEIKLPPKASPSMVPADKVEMMTPDPTEIESAAMSEIEPLPLTKVAEMVTEPAPSSPARSKIRPLPWADTERLLPFAPPVRTRSPSFVRSTMFPLPAAVVRSDWEAIVTELVVPSDETTCVVAEVSATSTAVAS